MPASPSTGVEIRSALRKTDRHRSLPCYTYGLSFCFFFVFAGLWGAEAYGSVRLSVHTSHGPSSFLRCTAAQVVKISPFPHPPPGGASSPSPAAVTMSWNRIC